jgi:rhodanese-related sulfurtransferase
MFASISKTVLLVICLFLAAFSVFGQVKSGSYKIMLNGLLSHSVPEVSVEEVTRKKESVVFLDAREPREYAVSHIPASISVGYDHFELQNVPSNISKDQPIVVYCSVGYRSEKVTEQLLKAGFTHVSNLYGGIFEWVNQDHPVVNQSGVTPEVHAYSRTWGVWLNKGKKIYK